MNLEDFLAPVRQSLIEDNEHLHPQALVHHIAKHTEIEGIPDLEHCKIAIIGVMEDRGTNNNRGAAQAPDSVRSYLYTLFKGKWQSPICDLGNIYSGESLRDSYIAVKEVIHHLLKKGITPIIIGGGQDLTYANYRAYDGMEQTVNLVSIDSRFDLGRHDAKTGADNFLSFIVLEKPYILYNYRFQIKWKR